MKHTLVATMADGPAVLNRVVSLFRQRGFAIDSLSIGKTHEPHVMRLTMVVDGSKTAVEQVVKQLYKVIEVRKVSDLTEDQTVERELALIKVTSKTSALRAEILQMVDVYRARVVDIAMGSLTVEVTGPADKIDSMVSMLAVRDQGDGPHGTGGDGARRDVRPGEGPRGAARSIVTSFEWRVASCEWVVTRNSQLTATPYGGSLATGVLRVGRRSDAASDQEDRRHRLRQPGARARAQPEGERLRRDRRPVSGIRSKAAAEAEGLTVMDTGEAAKAADVIMILTPDETQKEIFERDIKPNLKDGDTVMVAHGFLLWPDRAAGQRGRLDDRPEEPGHLVRDQYVAGNGVPALVAVHQDPAATRCGMRWRTARAGLRAGGHPPDDDQGRDRDRQLRGAGGALRRRQRAGDGRLRDAGGGRLRAELAYFECLHELKLIVDLFYRGGLSLMRYSVSNTAEFGDYYGPRIVDDHVKAAMKQLLTEIQNGTFANVWITENLAGRSPPEGDARQGRGAPDREGRRGAARDDAVHSEASVVASSELRVASRLAFHPYLATRSSREVGRGRTRTNLRHHAA